MMKNIFISILSLIPVVSLAHSGHLTSESMHGFLHAEHIIMFVVIGVVAYIVKVLRD